MTTTAFCWRYFYTQNKGGNYKYGKIFDTAPGDIRQG